MFDASDLQRQQAELNSLKEDLERSLSALSIAYRFEIDELLGRSAITVQNIEGYEPLLNGLEWRVRDEAHAARLDAERLAKLMDGISHDIDNTVSLRSLSRVPDEDWDEYMQMWEDYRKAKDYANGLLRKLHIFARAKIDPHR